MITHNNIAKKKFKMAMRFAGRFATRRWFNTTIARRSFREEMAAEEKHAEGTLKTWKGVSAFVAVPALALCTYNAITKEKEHHEHPRGEFVPYSHLRIRNKAFPWKDGNRSLFHNEHTNALPEGYADGEEH